MTTKAYGRDEKEARRGHILHAAQRLFLMSRGKLPSIAAVAAEAGLAKGTMYLYFRTKEEIFGNLLLDLGFEMTRRVVSAAQTTEQRGGKVAAIIDAFVAHIREYPQSLPLDALGHSVIAQNLEPQELARQSTLAAKNLISAGSDLDRLLQVPDGRGVVLLTRSVAMVRGLWQSAACAAMPTVPLSVPESFGTDAAEALTEYWYGALHLNDDVEEHRQ